MLHFLPSLPLSLFLLSFELRTGVIRDTELNKETQLTSKEQASVLSGFHCIESEKTQEPLVLIKFILESLDFDELIRVG